MPNIVDLIFFLFKVESSVECIMSVHDKCIEIFVFLFCVLFLSLSFNLYGIELQLYLAYQVEETLHGE